MSYKTSDGVTHIPKTEARGGRRVKGMTTVLGVSVLAAIIILALATAFFA